MNARACRRMVPLLAGFLALGVAAQAQAARFKIRRSRAIQTQTFTVATNAAVLLANHQRGSLADLKPGDRVAIAYTQANGEDLAHRISEAESSNQAGQGKLTQPGTAHHHVSGMSHAHGVVRSVNVQSGTVTITERRHPGAT